MELRQLRYFVAIAQHGGFSAASARIRIAQPALSAQIAALEKELGRQLLHRHARGVRLTPPGEAFLAHATDILERVDNARRALGCDLHRQKTEVTIGITPLVSKFLTLPLVEAAARDIPDVSLKIIEGMSGALQGWLDDYSVELAFMLNFNERDPRYETPLIDEDLYAVSTSRISFFDKEQVDEKDLLAMPLVATTLKNGGRVLLERIAYRYGIPLSIAAEVDSLLRQRELVELGKGVVAIPFSGLFDWEPANITVRKMTGEEIRWETSLVASGSQSSLEALRLFKPLILSLVRDLVQSGRWPGATLRASPS